MIVIQQFWKFLAKTFKNCHFWAQLAQKRGQYRPHPKQTKKYFPELTKADHKLSKTFYFIKIAYVLTELWMFFYFVVMFFLLKRVISSRNSCSMGHTQNKNIFFQKQQKQCISFPKLFILSKYYIYVLTELQIFFFFVVMFFAKKGHFQP